MNAQETRQEDALKKPRTKPMDFTRWPIKSYISMSPAGVKTAAHLPAETEGEVLRLGAEHAKHCHSMKMLPPDMTAQVKAAIKTVNV